MKILAIASLAGVALAAPFDVVVVGATPAGIAAALNAGRDGHSVALVEETQRIGGLLTAGLSYTDFRTLESVTGTFRDYMERVERYYSGKYGSGSQQMKDCFFGAHAEPRVSLLVLEQMLVEHQSIRVMKRLRLEAVETAGGAIRAARFSGGARLEGRIFIDATYEGDLAAMAAAHYRVGRESTQEFGERFAGVLFFDQGRILAGSTGEADSRVQCYNFRIIMTTLPENRVAVTKPAGYRREEFAVAVEHFRTGRIKEIFTEPATGILRVQRIPNGKADINDIKYAPVRLSLPGENYEYPDGSPEVRARIVERHRLYNLGLLYFLQNDSEIPEPIRAKAREWGLAKDEFEDTAHFPPRIYIREARRIQGEYTFTERDALMSPGSVRAPLHSDAVAVGDYALNCHGDSKPGPLNPAIAEGDFGFGTVPFQVPYGTIVARGLTNLLVPVAVSATHVGFSCLRLEPTWTALGQAAGIAAHLAIAQGKTLRELQPTAIQDALHALRSATIYFSDVPRDSPLFRVAQYFGTRGFFHGVVDVKTVILEPLKRRHGLQYSFAFPFHAAELGKPLDNTLRAKWMALLPEALRRRASTGPTTRGQFLQEMHRWVDATHPR